MEAAPGGPTPGSAPRSLKDRWTALTLWRAMTMRTLRLKIATWILRPVDAAPMGATTALQAMEALADLASFIEKSGEIRRRSHAYQKLTDKVNAAINMLHGAGIVGDPTQKADAMRRVFLQQRWLKMSKRRQRAFQKNAGAQAMVKDLLQRRAAAQ